MIGLVLVRTYHSVWERGREGGREEGEGEERDREREGGDQNCEQGLNNQCLTEPLKSL